MNTSGVILFYTTAAVLRAEKLLVKKGITIKLIPPPREYSSDCGIAIQFNWADHAKINKILSDATIETDSIHHL